MRSGLRTRAEPFLESGTVVSLPLVYRGELEAHTGLLWAYLLDKACSEEGVNVVQRDGRGCRCVKYGAPVGSDKHQRRRLTYDTGSCPPSIRSRRYDRAHHAVAARRSRASDARGWVDEPGHRAALRKWATVICSLRLVQDPPSGTSRPNTASLVLVHAWIPFRLHVALSCIHPSQTNYHRRQGKVGEEVSGKPSDKQRCGH